MALRLSPGLVRDALSAHSWLGLMVGALMYLICLSGALLVFQTELERWEQPAVPEFLEYDRAAAETAFNDAILNPDFVTEHMYLVLPTKDSPRLRISSEDASYFLNADGSRGIDEEIGFSEMLVKLHLYLHLPESWGIILVSATGAILAGLIVSGLFAHPKIFRDAFHLRLGGNRALTQTDIHNRLSVWGLPFHLLIAITGAYFGLALINLGVVAELNYDGDRDTVAGMVFTPDPEVDSPAGPVSIVAPLDYIEHAVPQASPELILVHDAGQRGQHVSLSAKHDGRLIYSENYRFDTDGTFIQTDGYADGPAGKQAVYSIYQLHFGWFAGFWVKLAYALLGLALAVVSVTGINLWLARRAQVSALDDAWAGIVWGSPFALALSAFTDIVLGVSATLAFWTALAAATALCLYQQDPAVSKRRLQMALVLSLAALMLGHGAVFGAAAVTGIGLAGNLALGLIASGVLLWLIGTRPEQALMTPVIHRHAQGLHTDN